MMLQVGVPDGPYARFDDDNNKGRIPTPEVIEDILRRLVRATTDLNANLLEQADAIEGHTD